MPSRRSIGAKVAEPKRPVIAYVGDGAWGMSFGESLACVRENIPVTAVVFNNGQCGAAKKNQVDVYANRFEGVNPAPKKPRRLLDKYKHTRVA